MNSQQSFQYNSGTLYSPSQQRQSFAIHEILGLSNCRQSPEFIEGQGYSNIPYVPGLTTQYPANGFDSQTQGFFRDQNVQQPPSSTFCPWRYDTASSTQPPGTTRYTENIGYGVKAPSLDEGWLCVLTSLHTMLITR